MKLTLQQLRILVIAGIAMPMMDCWAQTGEAKLKNKRLSFRVFIEADKSVGPERVARKDAELNLMSFQYYSRKRFSNIGARIRTEALYLLGPRISCGIMAGVTLRSNELYFGKMLTYNTLRIQFVFGYKLVGKEKAPYSLDLQGTAGLNIFKISDEVWTESTGPTTSLGAVINFSKFKIRTGYEVLLDNGSARIPENPALGWKEERVPYQQYRHLVFLGVGICLN